jgi:hypothetical protein
MFGGGMSGAMLGKKLSAGPATNPPMVKPGGSVSAYARPYVDKMQAQPQRPLTAAHRQQQSQMDAMRGANPSTPGASGLKSLDPAQFAALQKAQQGAPSVTPTPSMDKAYADMQAQKSGATPATSQAKPLKKGGSVKETKKMFGGGMSRMGGMGGMGMRGRMAAKPAAKPAAKAAPAAPATMKKGGDVKESKKMVGKELAFMKKKGAPKSMMKHEMAEAGMKVKKMASGGLASGHKSADGIASKGKTKAKQVKMAYGGKC